ncbi:unnamed protein product [Medioppia subpectinata]|uniref:Uncharacterized protein n=1 Tax=Medioppia subpectinata TaxID=1979941 RepID=A0A7R9Q852_9ACAR|nr:unnamed protein product [Medioppia subpectinata]CAG2114986.1 unnamed protein product [Medioppia subpectinata]
MRMFKMNAKKKTIPRKDKKNEKKRAKIKQKITRNRVIVGILSFVLFVISIYFIYLSFANQNTKLSVLDMNWRLSTIIRLSIALLGYMGTVLFSKRILVITMALIIVDITISFLIHCLSFKYMDNDYEEYLDYFANTEKKYMKESDCHFIKVFRRRIIENLILVSFYLIYVESIIALFLLVKSEPKSTDGSTQVKLPTIGSKWALILLSTIHFLYSLHLFTSKTFRSDRNDHKKSDFWYIFMWTLLAFLSMLIAFLTPFALLKISFKNKFALNFFISVVMSSAFIGSANFLIIIFNEIFKMNPTDDYYCNTRITSVDSFGSIFVLLIVNKIMISLLLSLAAEIHAQQKKAINSLTKIVSDNN